MSLLRSKPLFSVCSRGLSTSLLRPAGNWNKDWMPGPYPRTEEERRRAAKKYGLLPEEYKPVPDEGDGAGDYPDFKPFSVESRDPYYPWDFPEYRRNFGEPLHIDAVMYTEDRYDVNIKRRYSMASMLAMFSGTMITLYVLNELGKDACFLPAAKQHMPAPGVKNYTYQ